MFQTIPEHDPFFRLFPHRFDFLHAPHPKPLEKPDWAREDRYPLSDRHLIKGEKLYGVGFGAKTDYFMLDIDRGSIYHPIHGDRLIIGRIVDALEILGITSFVPITSSHSGGLHVYFPLPEPLPSWQLALVLEHLLKCKGLSVAGGTLEVFPNVCNFNSETGSFAKFNGHRLPLQIGSYLLNDDWELTYSSPNEFVQRWKFCEQMNTINASQFNGLLKIANRNYKRIGFKGEKFLRDLNTEIDQGWSDYGQTNHILGRIAMREYIFHHRIEGGTPLEGDRLIEAIARTATQLPGYQDYCRHKHEIYERAAEWARCVENSKYYHYGSNPTRKEPQPEKPSFLGWAEWCKQRATERLCFAISALIWEDRLPFLPTDRFKILTQEFHFSGATLYRTENLSLWHPDFIGMPEISPVETPPSPPLALSEGYLDACSEGARPNLPKSLLSKTDRNPNPDKTLEWFKGWEINETGCNTPVGEALSDYERIMNDWERSPLAAEVGYERSP